jgi:hypothetical protein
MGMGDQIIDEKLRYFRRKFFKLSCAHLIACAIVLVSPASNFLTDLYGLVALAVAIGPVYCFLSVYEEIKKLSIEDFK